MPNWYYPRPPPFSAEREPFDIITNAKRTKSLKWASEYSVKYEGRGAGSSAANTHAFGHESSASHEPRMSQHATDATWTEAQELSQTKGVADSLVWSTTHDRTYFPPQDMKPYAQHLLRCKTTSGMTVDTLHGSVASGSHVVAVGAHAVDAGLAPAEGFYPVRRPNGAREMLEVRYTSNDDAASPSVPSDMGPIKAASQSHPPQVNLLRHMTAFDVGSKPPPSDASLLQPDAQASRGDTGLSARTQRAAMVQNFAKITPALGNYGMTSTSRHYHGDLFGPAAELQATISHLKSASVHSTGGTGTGHPPPALQAQASIPAGLGKDGPATDAADGPPVKRFTIPRCFKSALGTMLEDEAVTMQLRSGKIRVPKGPRAKVTNADKLLYPPSGIPLAQG